MIPGYEQETLNGFDPPGDDVFGQPAFYVSPQGFIRGNGVAVALGANVIVQKKSGAGVALPGWSAPPLLRTFTTYRGDGSDVVRTGWVDIYFEIYPEPSWLGAGPWDEDYVISPFFDVRWTTQVEGASVFLTDLTISMTVHSAINFHGSPHGSDPIGSTDQHAHAVLSSATGNGGFETIRFFEQHGIDTCDVFQFLDIHEGGPGSAVLATYYPEGYPNRPAGMSATSKHEQIYLADWKPRAGNS